MVRGVGAICHLELVRAGQSLSSTGRSGARAGGTAVGSNRILDGWGRKDGDILTRKAVGQSLPWNDGFCAVDVW